MFVIKAFYSTGGSCTSVERQYHREYYLPAALLTDTIYRTVKQFYETGSVINVRGRKYRASSGMEAVVV